MIWFKIKALEKLLIEGKVSDKMAFNYLLTHLIFFTVGGYITDGDDPSWSLWVNFIISLGALIWGVSKTFEINQEGDQRDYLKRIISLSFVAGIRLLVLAFLVSFLIVLGRLIKDYYDISFLSSSFGQELFELFVFLCFNVIYYYMLFGSFKRINAADGTGRNVEVV